jgi:hypothetical protein
MNDLLYIASVVAPASFNDVTLGTNTSSFTTVNGQSVGHLWNYGLNTWGWEDTFGGGDHDYNDLVVGLDFTSASGHGWLA